MAKRTHTIGFTDEALIKLLEQVVVALDDRALMILDGDIITGVERDQSTGIIRVTMQGPALEEGVGHTATAEGQPAIACTGFLTSDDLACLKVGMHDADDH